MSLKLSSWAIRRPIPTIVLFFVLMVAGISSFQKLPINANPNVSFPIVSVSVSQAGASPEELENSVTRRVESAISGMTGVRHITSTITEGSSSTMVEFQLGVDSDRAVNDVRNAITQIRDELPQGINNPVVERVDIEGGALAYYAVQSPDMNQTELSFFIDETVNRKLLAQPGVQQVKRLGGEKQEIRVALKPERLNALGITAEQVSQQLAQTNANIPAGRTQLNNLEQSVRVLGSRADLRALAELPIALPDSRKVQLAELADISDSHAEVRSFTRLNGREVLGFNVFRAKGSSDTVVAQNVQDTLAQLQDAYPNIQIREVYNSVDATRENYTVAMDTLLEGAALTVLVVFLFLRNWRATVVSAVALVLSILPAFAVMHWLGYTLNSISLLAITLVIGILVDDAIVEIENIEQHLHMGKRPFQAALDASDAIGFAVVAITATIVAVFLPVSFVGGTTGMYFTQFGITVSAAVLASLLVARLATPLLAAYLLQPHRAKHGADEAKGRLKPLYLRLLGSALHHRKTTCLLGAALLAGSMMLFPLLPTGFMPKGDIGMSQIDVQLPPSSTLQQTDAYMRKIEQTLRQYDEVALVFTTAGSGGEVAKGEILIRLKPHGQRSISQKAFEDKARDALAQFSDIRFAFRNETAQRDVSILLTGTNPQLLTQTAQTLKSQMQGLPSVKNVQINARLVKSELQVKLLADEAAKMGVTPQAVGNLLRIATVGDTDANAARFTFPDRQVPIRVVLAEQARNDLATLRRLQIASGNGGTVALENVARLEFGEGAASLERFDRERRIAVEADLTTGATIGDAIAQVNALPVLQNLPDGVRMPDYGDAEYMNEMFEKFGAAMGEKQAAAEE